MSSLKRRHCAAAAGLVLLTSGLAALSQSSAAAAPADPAIHDERLEASIKAARSGLTTNFLQDYTNLAPSELFNNPDRDVHAVDVAMHELVMSPEEIAAEQAAKLKTTKH